MHPLPVLFATPLSVGNAVKCLHTASFLLCSIVNKKKDKGVQRKLVLLSIAVEQCQMVDADTGGCFNGHGFLLPEWCI